MMEGVVDQISLVSGETDGAVGSRVRPSSDLCEVIIMMPFVHLPLVRHSIPQMRPACPDV